MSESKPNHRPARTWEKITVEADSRMTESIGAYLADLSGTGIEISAAEGNGKSAGEEPAAFEKIIAYIPLEPLSGDEEGSQVKNNIKDFFALLTHIFPDCPEPEFRTEILEEEDWGRLWKNFFHTFQVTPTLTIKPTWEEADNQAETGGSSQYVIEMDPGLAFGTGHHASTRLALQLLEELFQNSEAPSPAKVLDVGTGSGILAMGCGLFGAGHVLALDNDPDAVVAAAENVERNRLSDRITVSGQDVTSLKESFDLIVANITHDILTILADTITNLLVPGGYLVLSGILKEGQADSIRKVYTAKGLHFIKSITGDEWAALQFQKN